MSNTIHLTSTHGQPFCNTRGAARHWTTTTVRAEVTCKRCRLGNGITDSPVARPSFVAPVETADDVARRARKAEAAVQFRALNAEVDRLEALGLDTAAVVAQIMALDL